MLISVTGSSDLAQTSTFLDKLSRNDIKRSLDDYGQLGVEALSNATPVESGLSAESWEYRIINHRSGPSIEWYNTNVDDEGTPVVILLQYGHGTGTGGYVPGHDFINPAMRPIFDLISNDARKKVIQ